MAGPTQSRPGKLDQQVVGNVGLYYVCYRLSLLGWNAMPTSRNARGVDILAYDRTASRRITVQVKALSKRSPVPLGTSLDHLFADFVVVCRSVLGTAPESFILVPAEIRRLAHRGERESRVSFWLQPREYEAKEYRENWSRIGRAS